MEIPSKALEYYLQGFRLHSQLSSKANLQAQEMFQLARKEHPKYARAIGHLAYTKLNAWLNGWIDTPEPPEDLRALADKAVELDPEDYDNHWSQAGIYLYTAKFQKSRAAACKAAMKSYATALSKAEKQAIPFNLNGLRVDVADAKFFTAAKIEDIDEAIDITLTAIASVNSKHPRRFLWTLGWAHFERAHFSASHADYIASLDALLKISRPSDNIIKNIIANYVALRWIKPAERLAHDFMCRNPKYTLAHEDRWPYLDAKRLKRWKDHLRQAGLPDKTRPAK
jgi:hypothetical protein